MELKTTYLSLAARTQVAHPISKLTPMDLWKCKSGKSDNASPQLCLVGAGYAHCTGGAGGPGAMNTAGPGQETRLQWPAGSREQWGGSKLG